LLGIILELNTWLRLVDEKQMSRFPNTIATGYIPCNLSSPNTESLESNFEA